MTFPPLGNNDLVVLSVSIDFLSKSKQDSCFITAYDYSWDDWDGLCDHLRDDPWEDILKFNASTAVEVSSVWNWSQALRKFLELSGKLCDEILLTVMADPFVCCFFVCFKKNTLWHFLWMAFNSLKDREPFSGRSLLFVTKYPEILAAHFIYLQSVKGCVDLGGTQRFSTRNPWIGNLAPKNFSKALCRIWLHIIQLELHVPIMSHMRFRGNPHSLPECQGIPSYQKGLISEVKWQQQIHNHLVLQQTLNHLAKLASLTACLSVCLQFKWLCIWVSLQSLIQL